MKLYWLDMEDFKNWLKNHAFIMLMNASAITMIWCAVNLIIEQQPIWILLTFISISWNIALSGVKFKEDDEDEKEKDEETEEVKID